MAEGKTLVQEQFDDMEQQRETAQLGMWLFLAGEVLFFGAFIFTYVVYHTVYPTTFAYGGKNTNVVFGSLNTFLLLTSGLTMVLAIEGIKQDKVKVCVRYLLLTIALGVGFLVVKGFEYAEDIHKHLTPGASFALPGRPASEMFFYIYWLLTGLHSLHLVVGIGVLAAVAYLAWRNRYSSQYFTPVELTGLYWGFVDIVWLYLYPLLYLVDRHGGAP